MKRRLGLLLAVILSLTQILPAFAEINSLSLQNTVNVATSSNAEEDSQVQTDSNAGYVNIPDENLLKALIERGYDKDSDGQMSVEEMEAIEQLHIFECGIKSIEGLQYASNIELLDIQTNQITDISPVAAMHNLRSLKANLNKLTDIPDLSSLESLNIWEIVEDYDDGTSLKRESDMFGGNQIPREAFKGKFAEELTEEWLRINSYDDTIIEFGDDKIRERICAFGVFDTDEDGQICISEIREIGNISLSYLGITDISGLEYAENMISLGLTGNKIQDITPLAGMKKILSLFLRGNNITDISALSNLTTLEDCELDFNNITDITPLTNCPNLQSFSAKGNQLTDVPDMTMLSKLSVYSGDSPRNMFKGNYILRSKFAGKFNEELSEEWLDINSYNPFAIISHPQSVAADKGDKISFSVAAEGDGLTYQWQYQLDGKTNWSTWKTKTGSTMSLTANEVYHKAKVRCVVSNSAGESLTSEEAIVTINEMDKLTITKHPESVTADKGDKVYFEVKANGNGLHYQWQYKLSGKKNWSTWKTKTESTMKLTVDDVYHEAEIRCIVTDENGETVISESAVVRVNGMDKLVIVKHPESVTANKGERVYFEVEATGKDLTYQWQYKLNGKNNWSTWRTKTESVMKLTVGEEYHGASIRCVITDVYGETLISDVVEVKVAELENRFEIVTHPVHARVGKGTKAYFYIEAIGTNLTYQWQYKLAGRNNWSKWSTKTASDMYLTASDVYDGVTIRCVITNEDGETLTSDEVVLTMESE